MRSHYPLDRHHEGWWPNCFCPDRGADARQTEAEVLGELAGWTATRWTYCCRKSCSRQPAVHHAGAGRHHPHTLGMLLAMYGTPRCLCKVIWGLIRLTNGAGIIKQLAQ